jgi:hypothetical protein
MGRGQERRPSFAFWFGTIALARTSLGDNLMNMRVLLVLVPVLLVAAVAILLLTRTPDSYQRPSANPAPTPPQDPSTSFADLDRLDASAPKRRLSLLFIHHSVGGALLAQPGAVSGDAASVAIFQSHPDGGGLAARLTQAGYQIHEASYGSIIGEGIDMFDWLPKFGGHMDRILHTENQDRLLSDGSANQIVLFETCFNSNWFVERGTPPGVATGPALTVENAKATFRELRTILERHPDVLFVHLTASPLAPRLAGEPRWKALARKLTGKPPRGAQYEAGATLAREFNSWLVAPDGWLKGYARKNIVVLDQYDILTGSGRTNALLYTRDPSGQDPHPSHEGLTKVAEALAPLLNRAVRRIGLSE